jgi:hypothetical protein
MRTLVVYDSQPKVVESSLAKEEISRILFYGETVELKPHYSNENIYQNVVFLCNGEAKKRNLPIHKGTGIYGPFIVTAKTENSFCDLYDIDYHIQQLEAAPLTLYLTANPPAEEEYRRIYNIGSPLKPLKLPVNKWGYMGHVIDNGFDIEQDTLDIFDYDAYSAPIFGFIRPESITNPNMLNYLAGVLTSIEYQYRHFFSQALERAHEILSGYEGPITNTLAATQTVYGLILFIKRIKEQLLLTEPGKILEAIPCDPHELALRFFQDSDYLKQTESLDLGDKFFDYIRYRDDVIPAQYMSFPCAKTHLRVDDARRLFSSLPI